MMRRSGNRRDVDDDATALFSNRFPPRGDNDVTGFLQVGSELVKHHLFSSIKPILSHKVSGKE